MESLLDLLFTDVEAGIFVANNLGWFFLAAIAVILAVVALGGKEAVVDGKVVYSSKDGYYTFVEPNEGDTVLKAIPVDASEVTYQYKPFHRLSKFFW